MALFGFDGPRLPRMKRREVSLQRTGFQIGVAVKPRHRSVRETRDQQEAEPAMSHR